MHYEWDEAKRKLNVQKHGVDFHAAERFEWDVAFVQESLNSSGEARYVAYAPIEDRLYVMVFTNRKSIVRIISFRKANAREVREYVEKTETHNPE